ncbi:isochorismate synthase MenF [Edaphovirga cremea]|uniref:isochorismate synthase MenF n=1 Tax=Edaphovirga cremea TaxID=2267246 RepID=UPI0039892AEA
MKYISGLLREVRQLLCTDMPATAGLRQFTVSSPAMVSDNMLEWLATQSLFPKFFWHQREGNEEVAACGQIKVFDDIKQANDFISGYSAVLDDTFRIWGLNAFDSVVVEGQPRSCYLFLPRLMLCRRDGQVTITLTLFSENSLRDDAHQALLFIDELNARKPLLAHHPAVIHSHHLPDYNGWRQRIELALDAIAQQQFEKVVLARKTVLTLESPLNAANFMASSRAVNHHCYHFMLALNPHYAFLGSSPERLFLRETRQLLTEALAGTAANADDDLQAHELADWLLHDSKNQRENLLVVDDICQRLQGLVEALDVMPAEILRLRKVQHLRRVINASLRRTDDADCLMRLQPTAAVAGLPRKEARDFILSCEPFSRDWYAGSAGYLSAVRSEFTVALRSACVTGNQLHLYAGAGIVAGSDPEQEWQEIENKAAGLRTLLERAGD